VSECAGLGWAGLDVFYCSVVGIFWAAVAYNGTEFSSRQSATNQPTNAESGAHPSWV